MSTGSHAPETHSEEHAADEQALGEHAGVSHGDDAHGDDEHGSDEPALGPVDVPAWAAAVGGILIGVAVAFCFALATAPT
jgi:hypothetical protein